MSETSSLDLDGAAGAETAAAEVRLPADGAFASVLRTLAAGLAARLDFTIDDIEDVRMVVSEATSLVLDQADAGADLHGRFAWDGARFTVEIRTDASSPEADYENFGWQVLAVLAEDAEIDATPGRYGVRATVVSSLAPTDAGSGS